MSAVIGGNAVVRCNWYRLSVVSLTAGLNSVPITESFSVMSCESSIGNVSGYYRNLGSLRAAVRAAVITARPAKRRSVSDSDVIVVGSAFILPLELGLFACVATIGQSVRLA